MENASGPASHSEQAIRKDNTLGTHECQHTTILRQHWHQALPEQSRATHSEKTKLKKQLLQEPDLMRKMCHHLRRLTQSLDHTQAVPDHEA